jgi:hypothetical protein
LFERNLQTGGKNYDETVPQAATIKVYHDREHASYVEVSVAREKLLQFALCSGVTNRPRIVCEGFICFNFSFESSSDFCLNNPPGSHHEIL